MRTEGRGRGCLEGRDLGSKESQRGGTELGPTGNVTSVGVGLGLEVVETVDVRRGRNTTVHTAFTLSDSRSTLLSLCPLLLLYSSH